MGVLDETYNTTAVIKRSSSTSSTATDSLTTVETASGLLRPITDTSQLFDEANFGREFKFWCDNSVDIKTGDMLTIDSKEYNTAGLSLYQDLEGDDSHYEARLIRK